MTRDEAFELLKKHVKSDRLLKHCLAVEAAMISYAEHFGEDTNYWSVVGLLHDIDFELYPDEHPKKAPDILLENGFDSDFADVVLSHSDETGVPRNTKVRKTLYAVDQMASFIVAVALMRPNKFEELKAKSVKKKMKDKAFARAVDRENLISSMENLGMEFAEHIDIIVRGLVKQEEKIKQDGLSLLG